MVQLLTETLVLHTTICLYECFGKQFKFVIYKCRTFCSYRCKKSLHMYECKQRVSGGEQMLCVSSGNKLWVRKICRGKPCKAVTEQHFVLYWTRFPYYEMKMPRWTLGPIRFDHTRDECVRQRLHFHVTVMPFETAVRSACEAVDPSCNTSICKVQIYLLYKRAHRRYMNYSHNLCTFFQIKYKNLWWILLTEVLFRFTQM